MTARKELPNMQIYESLCAFVLKWFNTDRGDDMEIRILKEGSGRTIQWINPVIGDAIRNAIFEVYIIDMSEFSLGYCCELGINITYNDGMLTDEEKEGPDMCNVLRVINSYNTKCLDRCIVYDEEINKIKVSQTFYFYPGSVISDNAIARILDDFILSKDIEDIAELVESGGWNFPELYMGRHFHVRERAGVM